MQGCRGSDGRIPRLPFGYRGYSEQSQKHYSLLTQANGMKPLSEVYNEDCMIGMSRYPDKFFDLAIVDPPYGIGMAHGKSFRGSTSHKSWKGREAKMVIYEKKDWDKEAPDENYFDELRRVSKDQIIW